MYPSHLLSNERASHYAELLREAEHARLLRLARPQTNHHLPHWFTRFHLTSIHPCLAPNSATQTNRDAAPALPAACCAACLC